MNKINSVKAHLRAGMSITARDAVELYSYYRLADGIFKLRQRYGMEIITVMVEGKDCRYAVYSLAT